MSWKIYSQVVGISLVVGAIILASLNREGWGWFLFVAVLVLGL